MGDELSHAPMVPGNELGTKLDDIATDWPGSGSPANLVAAVEDNHVMTGDDQVRRRRQAGKPGADNNDPHARTYPISGSRFTIALGNNCNRTLMGDIMLKELTNVPAGIQALEAVGTVTTGDYDRVFAPLVDGARRAGGRMRLLYQFGPGFERITAGALWADTRLGLGYLPLLDGCAVVSDIGWIRAPAHAIGGWMPCPLRVYDNDERDDAIAWLSALPGGVDVSMRDMAKAVVGGSLAAVGSLGGLVVSGATKDGNGTR